MEFFSKPGNLAAAALVLAALIFTVTRLVLRARKGKTGGCNCGCGGR